MYFTVEGLHGDWHEVGVLDAELDRVAVECVGSDAGLYRVRALEGRTWSYFWLPRSHLSPRNRKAPTRHRAAALHFVK
jgi:hypothetical protein